MKAYNITSDTHNRKMRLIADVTAEIFKFKTRGVEILSSVYKIHFLFLQRRI